MTVSFGDLTLDTETRQLLRGASAVPLSPKAFELLRTLVACRPRALSKTELQERLWPDTYVAESNLAGLIAEIRRAIGDDARTPRFMRTGATADAHIVFDWPIREGTRWRREHCDFWDQFFLKSVVGSIPAS